MEETAPPICLRQARDEMLLALDASTPEEESEHKALAEELMMRAVHSIQRQPTRTYDWAQLSPTRKH